MTNDELKNKINAVLDAEVSDSREIIESIATMVEAQNALDEQYLSDLTEIVEILKRIKDDQATVADTERLEQIRAKLNA